MLYFALRRSCEPCSTKVSAIPIRFREKEVMLLSFKHSRIALPKPPWRTFSSTVIILEIFPAREHIKSVSRGFTKRQLTTVADIPKLNNSECADSDSQLRTYQNDG
jgi:hypothetical protein